MSQEFCTQKRRWLKRILSARAPSALLLAPVLLSPVLTTAVVSDLAYCQAPAAASSGAAGPTSESAPKVDQAFVLGWLEYAAQRAEKQDLPKAAQAWAEVLRGRKILPSTDEKVEKRLKEVQSLLLSKGMTKAQIADAINGLGALSYAPRPAKPQFEPMPALPNPGPSAVVQAGAHPNMSGFPALPSGNYAANPTVSGPVSPGIFVPENDHTRTQPASSQIELEGPTTASASETQSGEELYRKGIEQLSQGKRDEALTLFRQAWQFNGEMDPALRTQLKDKLSSMQSAPQRNEEVIASPLDRVTEEKRAAAQRMMSEVTGEIAAAEANREAEPQLVAERLQILRTRVSQANLDSTARKQLLTIVDRAVTSHQIYMTQNRTTIEQDMQNRQITEQIALDQEERYRVDQQIASLVETYNDLMDKGSFAEAEVVAKQVGVLDRNSTIASLLISNSRNARRIGEYESIKHRKEDKLIDAYLNVDEASVPFDDRDPIVFPDAKRWEELTRSRARLVSEAERGMSPAEQAIWAKLKHPVLVDFKNRPLSEVVRVLSDMSGVLMHIDEPSLALEGVTSETPVTLSLPSQISLRSALNLLLNTQNLDFQVRNEVLMITSARNTGQANVQRTYSVKDLVIPIPNFVTDYNSGMAGAIRQAYETVGRGLVARTNGGLQTGLGEVRLASASLDPNAPVLGQLNNALPGGGNLPPGIGGGFGMGSGSGPVMGSGMMGGPMSMGSGGAIGGGAAMADFDTLMNLIMQTIEPDSWLIAGGTSSVIPYPANLSLVVSAPQTTHEKITDLLESLRRLQDLQVTIEVKFITLNDNFFERIGVDFDLRIDDNVRQLPEDDGGPSTVVGLSAGVGAQNPFPVTADFDIALSQDSFASAVPAFGGFDAASGASLGFAILSDLEMFFFMNAAQGDQRTNVLQAPRVTMFDGQFASINDTVQRPFVTSLIPVVADFAVAQQPVIVVLNEGTVLNVQATVSPDKRFVRLTLNPSFSQIDRVDTFTFEGSRTTRSSSDRTGNNVLDPTGSVTDTTEDEEEIVSGTTVQQPSFAQTSVSTTVSVPDGGTILLGGIKRMREGRIERGVPILSKIPYVNRLFKNTAIGRETSTLMMTVTPRIIIQEEEEQKYGVLP